MHALIFDIDALSSMVVEQELRDIGYISFDWSPDERNAIQMASTRFPDLIVAGDLSSVASAVAALQEISKQKPVPVVFIASGSGMQAHLPAAVVMESPFHPRQFREAVDAACLIIDHKNLTVWQMANMEKAHSAHMK